MARNKRPSSAMRRLHRSFGAAAAVFVLFMVLSGIAINHSNDLGLDRQAVSQSFMLDWYGLGKPENIRNFAVGSEWLSFAGSQLYLNDKSVATLSDGVGAISNGELFIAAGSDELLLLDLEGNLIERIPWAPIGVAPIESVGLHADTNVAVKSANRVWLADAELLNWRPAKEAKSTLRWSSPESVPDELKQAITHSYRGEGPSLERLLLDLHSGRIFGSIGVLIYDLLALALGFLSVSGLVLWFRSRRNGKPK